MIKTYIQWINEDFSQVGAAPDGNIEGMGNVAAPDSNNGSGDSWPSIEKHKRKKKKKNPKLLQEVEWIVENKIDREKIADVFINKLKNLNDNSLEFMDWWCITEEMEKTFSLPMLDNWEREERSKNTKKFRGEIYCLEFKIKNNYLIYYRLSYLNIKSLTFKFNSDMNNYAQKTIQEIFDKTLVEFGLKGIVTGKKFGI